jgi:iron complex transport system permease protein
VSLAKGPLAPGAGAGSAAQPVASAGRSALGLVFVLLISALALTALGVCVGSTGFENLLQPLLNPALDVDKTAMAQQIVFEIRLPRTLGAWAAGALLGLAGAVAQGLFRNPLADPYLLGSASGASLGVALALAALGGGAGMLNGGMVVSVFSSSVWVRLGLTGAAFHAAWATPCGSCWPGWWWVWCWGP